MNTNQEQIKKEDIYSCIKCHCPLSSSISVRVAEENYGVILKSLNDDLDSKEYKCIFILNEKEVNESPKKKFCYDIDFKIGNIFCKNDKEIVGIIRTIYIDLVNQKLTFGYLNTKNIEITKVGFKLKKEIPVYSQEQYTVLAKLKQLRYYVKQLTPTLKASMDLIKEERNSIYECEDSFEKYKLDLVINRYKEIQKEQIKEEKESGNNK